VKLFSWNSPYK